MKPGEVYELTIRLYPTSNLFRAGHRIRLEISSSNFPRFDLNPNTGEPVPRQNTDLIEKVGFPCPGARHFRAMLLAIFRLLLLIPTPLAALRGEGCEVAEKTEESEYGKVGWVMDPEGNKIELWEPPPGQLP